MIRGGVYTAKYSGIAYEAQGVFVLRNGAFVGVGQAGAVYEGKYWSDHARGTLRFDGSVRFPPNTALVTGGDTGPNGITAQFRGEGPPPNPQSHVTLQLEGQPVSLVMSFVSAVPG